MSLQRRPMSPPQTSGFLMALTRVRNRARIAREHIRKLRDILNGISDVAGESNRTVQDATLRANPIRVLDDRIIY